MVVHWAILDTISALGPASDNDGSQVFEVWYSLKFWPLAFISLRMQLMLLVISFVFSALTSMP